jgi:hypothetical protein
LSFWKNEQVHYFPGNRFSDSISMYKVQLNGYATIFEKLGMGKVGGLGLCYYEPHGYAPTVSLETVVRDDGFVMPY